MLERALTSLSLALVLAGGLGEAPAGNAAPAPPAKLEAFLSYPFLDDLTASANGTAIAWVENRKGVRNVWLARAPDFSPRALTAEQLDDGQQLASLAFSADGRVLAWVRGGGEHNAWARDLPPPNPASAVQQPHLQIWASLDGGAPMKVAEDGEGPVVSSTGRIAYIKDGQVFTVDPSAKAPPAKLFYDRGRLGALAWSPDGAKLAFVSRRSDHSFIGVYSGPDQPIVWMAPSTSLDDNPVWSPDGRRIAFSRQGGLADLLSSRLVEKPNPFSIWVGSPETGSAAAIWRSPKTLDGSYPELPDGLFLMWGTDDRLSFRAEMDGWPHLYSIAASGGEPRLLTPGSFMVEHVSMAPDRRTLFFDANAGPVPADMDRRHLFKVSLAGGPLRALTSGSGLEWTPAPAGPGEVAFISSTPTTAMALSLTPVEGGAAHVIRAPDPNYGAGLVVPQPVTFTAPDGLVIHGQVFVPRDGKAKHPGLIFVHGGPPRQMLLGWSYLDYYAHAYAMNQFFASRGFEVLSVNYRLGIGYGRAFQHPAKAGIAGDSEYQDVLAGARFLQGLTDVDPARIGIWGGSYGGLLTAQALAHNSDIFKVGVDFHGVHDWSLYPGEVARPQRYEQGDYEAVLKSAFESSPEAALSGWTSPVLLIAGDDDRNVRFDQTVDLARRLQAQGVPFEELIIPNEIHGFLRFESWFRADTASDHFLEKALKP